MVINSINGLNNVEIRANDAHGMAASEAPLRKQRFPQFGANNFLWQQNIIRDKSNYTAYNWNMITKN